MCVCVCVCVCVCTHDLSKSAVIIRVPKKSALKEFNDYSLIALTSIPFKCLEQIVLKYLLPEIDEYIDPHQISYMKKDPLMNVKKPHCY